MIKLKEWDFVHNYIKFDSILIEVKGQIRTRKQLWDEAKEENHLMVKTQSNSWQEIDINDPMDEDIPRFRDLNFLYDKWLYDPYPKEWLNYESSEGV
jgi:hypothetical protein